MSRDISVDASDLEIVEQLRINGRATSQQIADRLGMTATTVSARIRRMEEAGTLRIVAVSDFAVHGINTLMEVAVEVDGRSASEVVQELAEIPEVFAAHLVTGRYDIDMLVALRGADDLSELLLSKFAQIRGIRSMMPAIVVEVVKYAFDVVPNDAVKIRARDPQYDELDGRLIEELSKDARVSNRKIANRLDVTEGTVRGRIRRLQEQGLIAITAVTSFKLGNPAKLAYIAVQANADQVRQVASELAQIDAINAVMITLGQANIRCVCRFHDLDQLHNSISDQIFGISGVRGIETSIAVKTVKYNSRIVRLIGSKVRDVHEMQRA